MRKKALKLDHVKRFVLDECDKLLEQLGASFYVHASLVMCVCRLRMCMYMYRLHVHAWIESLPRAVTGADP